MEIKFILLVIFFGYQTLVTGWDKHFCSVSQWPGLWYIVFVSMMQKWRDLVKLLKKREERPRIHYAQRKKLAVAFALN